jgi:NADPH-dependent curcumin reductase CurA
MGRIVLCGAISQYGANPHGPANYLQIVAHSLTMRGFIMKDYIRRIPEAVRPLAPLVKANKIVFHEHILDGFDMIFAGRNFGKLMIKV